jgi:hypothetical protein
MVPTAEEAGCAPEIIWLLRRREKSLASLWILKDYWIVQALASSLY